MYGYDTTPITNNEVCNLIERFKKIISEKIFSGEIKDEIDFVIISKSLSLSMAITPTKKGENWWGLIIKTVFRESDNHNFFTDYKQLVIEEN